MNDIKIRLNFTDVLFLISMVTVLSFPQSSRIKAILIMLFFGYMVFITLLSKRKIPNVLHSLWAIAFFALCYFSKYWAAFPNAVNEQISNVLWSMMLSVGTALYILYNDFDTIDIAKRFCFLAVLFAVNVVFNSTFEGNRLSVSNNANTFGKTAISMAGFFLFWCKKKRWKRAFPIFMFALMSFLALLSGSRKAILALLLYIIAYVLFEHLPKNFFKVIGRLLIAAVICWIIYLCIMNIGFLYNSVGNRVESMFDFFSGDTEADGSVNTRFNMIEVAKEIFIDNPILGAGLNNFKYLTYHGTYAHNNYYELLACLGIVGFVIYYLPLAIFLLRAVRLWRKDRQDAIVPLAILTILFVSDFAAVSYFSLNEHVFLGVAIGTIYKLKNNNLDVLLDNNSIGEI